MSEFLALRILMDVSNFDFISSLSLCQFMCPIYRVVIKPVILFLHLFSLIYKIPLLGVISRPAASTSCRSFFITSA